jgi:predicted metal-binding protein
MLNIVEHHFPESKEIPIDTIAIKEAVRKLCERNACGHYGKNWACPPALPPLDEMEAAFARYQRFALVYRVYPVKSSWDLEGMMTAIKDFGDRLAAMRDDLPPDLDHLLLGAGSCLLCPSCSYIDGEVCRRPNDMLVSLEACGIDVMRLMKVNGLPYYGGPNTVTYIGGLAFDPKS